MELSRAAQFAIRAVLDLTTQGPAHTADIAARRGIPPAQAGKIVQQLARGGIVRTTRGAGGGVRLAKAAERITLRQIIDAIEGPLTISRCIAYNDCPCIQPCPVRTAMGRIQHDLERQLDSVTVADLSAGDRAGTAPQSGSRRSTTTPEEG